VNLHTIVAWTHGAKTYLSILTTMHGMSSLALSFIAIDNLLTWTCLECCCCRTTH